MADIFFNEKDIKAKAELDKKLRNGLSEEEKVYLAECLKTLASQSK